LEWKVSSEGYRNIKSELKVSNIGFSRRVMDEVVEEYFKRGDLEKNFARVSPQS
jgi:hypothetical protein